MTIIDATTLADMTISLLERTAMVLAEPVTGGDSFPRATRFARIGYTGPSRGSVVLCATDGFLREVASSLLGVEGTEVNVETDGVDALKEMANTVGGSVILALSPEMCEYSLGLPELIREVDVPRDPHATCTVLADGGSLSVMWRDENLARAA